MRRAVLWSAVAIVSLLILLVSVVALLIGTEAGTRWLLARAKPYLPAQLDIGAVHGTLLGGFETRGLRWSDAGTDVVVDRIALRVYLRPLFSREVRFPEIEAEGIDIELIEQTEPPTRGEPFGISIPLTVEVGKAELRDIAVRRGAFERSIESVALAGSLSGSELRISTFDVQSDWLTASLAGDGELEAPFAASATLDWRYAMPGADEYAGRLSARGNMDEYRVEHRLRAPGEVDSEGSIAFRDGALHSDLMHRWRDLVISADGNTISSPDGRLRLVGTTESYRFEGDALVEVTEWPAGHVDIEGVGSLEGIRAHTLIVESDAGRVRAAGELTWQPVVSWNVEFNAEGLDPSVAQDRFQGSIDAAGRSSGSVEAGGPNVELELDRIGGTLNDQPIDGKLGVTLRDTSLSIRDADVRVGENRVQASGRIRDELDLAVVVRMPRVATLIDGASGELRADMRVQGAVGNVAVSGQVSGSGLRLFEYSAETLTARGRIAQTGVVDATLDATAIGVRDFRVESVDLQLKGNAAKHAVDARIRAPGEELVLAARGGLVDSKWAGRIDALQLTSDRAGRWVNADGAGLSVSKALVSLDRLCLQATAYGGNVCAAIDRVETGDVDFDVSLTGFPLTALALPLPAGVVVNGEIRAAASGRYAADANRLNADANVDITNARFSAEYEGETITATFEEGVMNAAVENNALTSELRVVLSDEYGRAEGGLAMRDVFDRASAIDGRASLDINDLSIFPILLPSVSDTKGRISGSVTVGGTVTLPQFIGAIALHDGAFAVRRAGINVTEVNAELRQREPGNIGVTGSARSGDGTVTIDGSSQIVAGGRFQAQIDIDGDSFEIIRLPDWRVVASPAVAVQMDPTRAIVKGDIVLPAAKVTINTIPETAERSSPDAVVHRAEQVDETVRRRIDVNINARLGSDVRVDAFGLSTGLDGAVNITGGTHTPYLGNGRLKLREGRYEAYGQSLKIEEGELIFNGPLNNPNLDVRTVRETRDVVAGVHLTGTPRQLQSTVYSEPPLSDAEALSYLLTGRPLATASAGEGEMLNRAAFALGLSQAGAIASQVGSQVGLDTLTVEGGADESRIVAGKQVNNRLFVEYGYGLVNNLGRLLLRYELSQRLVVESTSGAVNTIDLVYSVKKQ